MGAGVGPTSYGEGERGERREEGRWRKEERRKEGKDMRGKIKER